MIVFIVDDDEKLLSVLGRAARNAAFDVVTCKSSAELSRALEEYASEPRLIVIDVHMEDVDGIEAIDGLLEHNSKMRVRFMTGGADTHAIAASMIAKSRGLNVGRSLFKPFALGTFVDILRSEQSLLSGA
jgi:DNA-binding NtrC family response regulator